MALVHDIMRPLTRFPSLVNRLVVHDLAAPTCGHSVMRRLQANYR